MLVRNIELAKQEAKYKHNKALVNELIQYGLRENLRQELDALHGKRAGTYNGFLRFYDPADHMFHVHPDAYNAIELCEELNAANADAHIEFVLGWTCASKPPNRIDMLVKKKRIPIIVFEKRPLSVPQSFPIKKEHLRALQDRSVTYHGGELMVAADGIPIHALKSGSKIVLSKRVTTTWIPYLLSTDGHLTHRVVPTLYVFHLDAGGKQQRYETDEEKRQVLLQPGTVCRIDSVGMRRHKTLGDQPALIDCIAIDLTVLGTRKRRMQSGDGDFQYKLQRLSTVSMRSNVA